MIIQWVNRTETGLTEVSFPINFSTDKYFAIGTIWKDDSGMTSTAFESQIFPTKYYVNKVVFGSSTSVRRNIFAIGY